MAIVFNCPQCNQNYRLKDEFAGKTATCKNPKCRHVLQIPFPKEVVLATAPVDVDALAAAAFQDDGVVADAGPQATIAVTCSNCDHAWSVDGVKEGKNVLCPECQKLNRVPLRKKIEKADWRTGSDGRPTLAKRETGTDVAGAINSRDLGTISGSTAREILKTMEEPEEPGERLKRLSKRAVLAIVLIGVVGGGGYYLATLRKTTRMDGSMASALQEIKDPSSGAKDSKFHAILLRASAEYRIRSAENKDDADKALEDFRGARNAFQNQADTSADRHALLAELAVSMVAMLGTNEQVTEGKRHGPETVKKEIRQTLQKLSATEPEIMNDTIRALTRKFVEKQQPSMAVDIAQQLTNPNEVAGQVGLELVRLNQKAAAEELLKKLASADAPSLQALRAALAKPAGDGPTPNRPGAAEAYALLGDTVKAKATASAPGKAEEKALALISAGRALADANPTEAAEMLEGAARLLGGDARGQLSPWITVRVCRLLGRVGKADTADTLADTISDPQVKAWAKLEVMRGRLSLLKDQQGHDAWLDEVGDPTKSAAAAKAREELARHNAAVDLGYLETVNAWTKGNVRPFGLAGLILGQQDGRIGK